MSNEPSRVGFPDHLSRILVIDITGKVHLRTSSLADAATLWSNNTSGFEVRRIVGIGTEEEPVRHVTVGPGELREALSGSHAKAVTFSHDELREIWHALNQYIQNSDLDDIDAAAFSAVQKLDGYMAAPAEEKATS